jgi:hypothetical protein
MILPFPNLKFLTFNPQLFPDALSLPLGSGDHAASAGNHPIFATMNGWQNAAQARLPMRTRMS